MKWPILLALLLLACPVANTGNGPMAPPTVEITNDGPDIVHVYTETGQHRSLHPNEIYCMVLYDPRRQQRLKVVVNGAAYLTPEFTPDAFGGGWTMEIGSIPRTDVLSLMPAEKCRRVRDDDSRAHRGANML